MKSATSQPQLEHKLSQLDSKFEALTKQVSGSMDEMEKTITAKLNISWKTEVTLFKLQQFSSTPATLKPSSVQRSNFF